MKTYERRCIKDFKLVATNGDAAEIKSGSVYLTSDRLDWRPGEVMVFTNFWFPAPLDCFGDATAFTL